MASLMHTYGSQCRLAPVAHKRKHGDAPAIDAQFFYSSAIPIDEPLSAQLRTASSDKATKSQLRPFSPGDNNSLERVWLSLASNEHQNDHERIRLGKRQSSGAVETNLVKRRNMVRVLAADLCDRHPAFLVAQHASDDPATSTEATGGYPDLYQEISDTLQQKFCSLVRKTQLLLDPERVAQDTLAAMRSLQKTTLNKNEADSTAAKSIPKFDSAHDDSAGSNSSYKRLSRAVHKRNAHNESNSFDEGEPGVSTGRPRSASQIPSNSVSSQRPNSSNGLSRSYGTDVGISGQPFVRVETTDVPAPNPVHPPAVPTSVGIPIEADKIDVTSRDRLKPHNRRELKETEGKERILDVVVGVSRLHKVTLPTLQMKPIYWSPVNDVSVVTRGTWFYR